MLIFHPSVAPFVQQAARALLEAGELDRFITTLRYDPRSVGQRLACRVGQTFGFDLATQLKRRTITELPSARVESHPWGEIARLLSSRLDRSGRLTDLVWERTEPAFDRLVARRIRPSHEAVYGFEYSSLAAFTRARELGLRVVYDMPAPEPRFVQKLLEAEVSRYPELRSAYHRHTAAREEHRIARRRAEWDAAHLVIVASRFTKNSFATAGLDVAKVQIVPYGAPPVLARQDAVAGGSRGDEPLRLIWAGTFSVRKGAHYLLDTWRREGFGRHARLQVFGAVTLPDSLLAPKPSGIEFAGSLPRSQLMDHYRTSDALIFPTLCDGFGMVVTEAWSRGLPVITTDRAGAADLLQPQQNGVLIQAGDADAIGAAIAWCLSHRRELREMRAAALATAANWQWSDYRRSLAGKLTEAGIFRRPTFETNR
jgi:glycosyltransferase involved in cell wall biosynthesis